MSMSDEGQNRKKKSRLVLLRVQILKFGRVSVFEKNFERVSGTRTNEIRTNDFGRVSGT